MATDLRTCNCGTRIIFPRTPEGKKLPPVNYTPDPAGTMAARHDVTGTWTGRFLAKDEQPIIPEKRYALHWCEHMERRRQHRRGRTLTPARPRRKPCPQPALDFGTPT